MVKINVEVNGIFKNRLIQRKMSINIPKNMGFDALLLIVGEKIGLSQNFLKVGNWVFLLNGRRIDPNVAVRLKDSDTLTILSPLAGG